MDLIAMFEAARVADPCACCGGSGEHDTGRECYRCDGSGQAEGTELNEPIPCDGAFPVDAGGHTVRTAARQQEGDTRRFGDYELRYRTRDQAHDDWNSGNHFIEAFHPDEDEPVARMTWGGSRNPNRIQGLDVRPAHRRNGLATAMWEWGQEMTPRPKHSDERTNDGDAWARSVGGPLPRRRTANLGDATDWSSHYDELPDTVHRGYALKIPGDLYDLVNDHDADTAAVAEKLAGRTSKRAAGLHWSARPETAKGFALDAGRTGSSDLPVVLHASRPAREDIESRPHILKRMQVFDFGGGAHDEREVPLRKGRKLSIHGISWHPHEDHPAADEDGWVHHTFAEPLRHTAAAEEFTPHERIFGRTYGLDHRLFDGDHLKPMVRAAVLTDLDAVLRPLLGADWQSYIKVYLAGSEASEWTSETLEGNGDFDTLLGVNYDALRHRAPAFAGDEDNTEIDDRLNQVLRAQYNRSPWATPFGTYDRTGYVNNDAYDITKIRPYAAYDITDDTWAVRPPHLPGWDVTKMNPSVVAEVHAVEAYIRSILALPEPMRTQQGAALWDHLHSDRSRAFGPNGQGWWDPANIIEKWLDQEGLWAQLLHLKKNSTGGTYDEDYAPAEWSNTPIEALAAQGGDYSERAADLDMPDEIHRGLAFRLPQDVHDAVRDESRPVAERAQVLADHLRVAQGPAEYHKPGQLGHHWTTNPGTAEGYSKKSIGAPYDPETGKFKEYSFEPDPQYTRVVLHAGPPKPSHLLSSERTLRDRDIFGYEHSEKEVPFRRNAPITLKGISFGPNEPGAELTRHDFDQPLRFKAAADGPPVEQVRVDALWPHREWEHTRGQYSYERDGGGPYAAKHDPQSWDASKADIAEHGIRNPITLEYNPAQHAAYVGEGNHRLTWARELGLPTVPVRISRTTVSMHPRYELPGDVPGPDGPGDLRPSDVLPEHYFPERKTAAAERFYHGTGEVFAPGDTIEPRMPQAGGTRYPYVYTSKDPARAYGFGVMKSSDPHVYEVEHTGEYRKDPHTPGSAYRTREPVRVIREIKDPPKTPWEERTAGARGDLPEKLFIGIHQPHDWDDDRLHQLDEHYSGWVDESPSSEVDLNDPDELRYVHAYDLGHPDPAKRRLPIGFIRYHENNVPSSVGRSYISVDNMAVHPDYRRRGVASAMQDKLADTYRGMHIDHGNRTPEGEAWAEGWKKRASSDGDYWVDCGQGHTHWGANGAAGMLIRHTDDKGTKRYLLQKRAPWVDHGNTWGIPGGAIGGHEEPEEGARRETEEEMGELPHDVKHSHTVTDDHGGWAYHTVIADSPHMFTPEEGDDDESRGHGWFTAEEMKDLPLHPGFAKTWDKVRRSRTDKTAAVSNHWIAHEHELRGPDEYEDEDEMPSYIGEDIDRRNEHFDRAWNRLSPSERTNVHHSLRGLANQKMFIGTNTADEILRNGRMKTLAEGIGNRRTTQEPEDYEFDRRALEHHVMGVPETEAPEHHPIYGSLHDDPSENVYGQHQLELKPHVRSRTSVSMGDSGNNMLRGYHIEHVPDLTHGELRAMTDPQELPNLAAGVKPKSYMEMQVHGGVSADDIAAVHVHEGENGLDEHDRRVMAEADKRGIPIVHHKPDPNFGLTDKQVAILKGHG